MIANTVPVRVAIDVETTGLQVETESIIEIGAITFRGAEILDAFETMIDPGRPLPYRIQRLTHITPAMLVGAPHLGDVAPRLRTFIGDMPLVGHSVGFDAGFLRKGHIAERNMLLDTFELASLLLPTLNSYSLENVAASLHLSAPVHHRALADAVLARDVLLALEARIAQLPDPLLNDLCELASPAVLPMLALLRQEQRARGSAPARVQSGSFGGALGAALNAKMRVDPAVLGTRVAALGPAYPVPASEMIAPEAPAGEADERIDRAINEAFSAREMALIEISSAPECMESVLAPALAWAAQHDRRLVIAAGSMAGVRTLMRRHIPRMLATLTPEQREGLTVAPLYEAQDYLCTHRWYGPGREGATTSDGLRGLAKLTLWMHATDAGVRDEVSLNPKESIAWESVRAGAQFVHLADCAYRERGWCFLHRARQA
ncbi:MAG TPA: exonuclease domain-containing protein, partial [Ktedonobacterales bacterium]|nr:exonuclease domain-containing protein [Ktedonobacterales bacterium]